MHLTRIAFFAFLVVPGHPVPVPQASEGVTPVSNTQVATYRPYTYFASAGYCPANSTLAWSCGANCLANPDFKPIASGGEGVFVQYWFVGYSPSLKRVIVSHEGSRLNSIVSMLTDASILQTTLNSALFPGIGSDISVHAGFLDEHAKTATLILSAVEKALGKYDANHVTLVGHSLVSGALALLDSVYLPLHLPSAVKFNTVTYGLPRVGNLAFANYVDAHLSLTRINNQKDIVPILPSRIPLPLLDYQHPAGEIHIQASGEWDSCQGQENESKLCSAGGTSLLTGSIANHDGLYEIEISCSYLTDV
ncbi:Alpha/Beta hydrolase protein [Mycena metata]|uniref:Alpha/Beta hydrolase protein n=1 Tax=Mycena metata TaxID=1033252 RepID=A0AAD7K3A1_9AGAR|nr:Alpha/Beta hydrolase protein [Mycena metata]